MRKIILILVFMIVLSGLASGSISMFDTGFISINGTITTNGMTLDNAGYNLTQGDATNFIYHDGDGVFGSRGIMFEGDGGEDQIGSPLNTSITFGTIVFDIRLNSSTAYGFSGIAFDSGVIGGGLIFGSVVSGSSTNFAGFNYQLPGQGYFETTLPLDTNFHHIIFTWNNTGYQLFEDNFDNLIYSNDSDVSAVVDGFVLVAGSGDIGNITYLDNIYVCTPYKEDCSPPKTTFKITAINNFNGSLLSGFNATLLNDTSIVHSDNNTGTINIFNMTSIVNVTVFKDDYFNSTFFNYNTSFNLEASLFQSQINFTVQELFTGNPISNFSINLTGFGIVLNTSGSSGLSFLNVGNYTGNVIDNTGEDDFHTTNSTFEVFALDNKTHVFRIHQHIINVTAINIINNVSINNFNLTVFDLNLSSTRYFTTTNGTILVPVIHNTYNLTILAGGFTTDNNTDIISITGDVDKVFYLYESNSMLFSIFDLETLALTTSLINIELLGSTVTINTNTSNGSMYINNLNDDTYKISFTSDAYDTTILFGTISGGNRLIFDVFMKNGTQVDFIVQDQNRVLQGNVTLTLTQTINGSEVTIGQVKTDFSGRASIFLDSTIDYGMFVSKEGFNTFTGRVTPTQAEYTIIIQEIGASRFVSIFDDLVVDTTFSYTPLSGFAFADLILNSPSGSLSYYGMNTTYDSINYFVNTSGFPAGGVESFNITGINPSIEPTVFINYWIKYNDRVLTEWNATYLVSDVVPTNISLEDGLFDDLEALDEDNPIRGLMGALIILVLVVMFSFSKDLTITAIGGLIGVGINWKFSLMPQTMLSVSAIVIIVLILADNIGGGK